MLAFREVRQHLAGRRLLDGLQCELHSLGFASGQRLKDALVSALLRAGELECALADADSPHLPSMMQVTDILAEALLSPDHELLAAARASALSRTIEPPLSLRVSPPEGFCYYALHPLDLADLLKRIDPPAANACVIGIRSIGTTLSSVVTSWLKRRSGNHAVQRVTVRPRGGAFDRELIFSDEETSLLRRMLQRSAMFYVVDEGPGLSGSTFLAVGDSLRALGVPNERITFLCTRDVDPEDLLARDGAQRWGAYRSHHTEFTQQLPKDAGQAIHWGDWRPMVFEAGAYRGTAYEHKENWPAVWMSSAKYLSRNGCSVLKYEGLGRYGNAVRDRAALMAEAGFGPAVHSAGNGFSAYAFLRGTLISAEDISEGLLERIAHYIAFRKDAFRSPLAEVGALEEMARHNFRQITGTDLPQAFALQLEHPVICDARMMPHKWLLGQSGDCRLWKLDGAAHGDGHFFPGPCDIAWDLAGTIVEFGLTAHATQYLLTAYRDASGDNVAQRIENHVVAYAAFQAGYSSMAAQAMHGTQNPESINVQSDEERLHRRDAARYSAWLQPRQVRTMQAA